jgi:hypothetical protein
MTTYSYNSIPKAVVIEQYLLDQLLIAFELRLVSNMVGVHAMALKYLSISRELIIVGKIQPRTNELQTHCSASDLQSN